MGMQRNGVRLLATAGALTLAVWVVAPAWAVDGVIEINQASVKAAGGFPFVISQSGSYRLTSNLNVTDATARPPGMAPENTTAIQANVDDVSIDLNGFTIKGPCVGSPVCSPTGVGEGISAHTSTGITVVNGTVQGMGSHGINIGGNGSQVERIRAAANGGDGIVLGGASTANNCTAYGNGRIGIDATTVLGCTAANNGNAGSPGYGISGLTVLGSTATGNAGIGINAVGVTGHNICDGIPCP